MSQLLIYGAGAIGRGYVPWLFPEGTSFIYVEQNPILREAIAAQQGFTTVMVKDGEYVSKWVNVTHCLPPGGEVNLFDHIDGIITAVGPRQVYDLKEHFTKISVPILLFENDSFLAEDLRHITGKQDIYFGVPDVITSNTAPQHLLDQDPTTLITENGVCFADEGAKGIGGDISYVSPEELRKQWIAKLYVHNTPHCIAAYLGSLVNATYLHEGMAYPKIDHIVEHAMLEMCAMIKERHHLETDFVQWYADKELSRFRNELLCDPIIRVAREPFRKLQRDNRLIGASQLALSCGIVPHYCIKGIIAAIFYENEQDPDYNITILRRALEPDEFLTMILGLSRNEALFELILDNWDSVTQELKELSA